MENNICCDKCLFMVIVQRGKADKCLMAAKEIGAHGGTIVYGEGTVKSGLLNLLEINDIKKEILIMAVDKEIEEDLHRLYVDKFAFSKPNKGIAFSMNLNSLMGIRNCSYQINKENKEDINMSYEAVFVVVDRGKGDDVIQAADKAGAKGATVIHGRGSGIHEKGNLFGIIIEPEKEVVILLVKKEITDNVIENIRKDLEIDKPGKGIIFVLDVNKTSGLLEK